MTIKFLGAAGTVTGSSYVLTSGSGKSILVDLGMFQGVPEIDDLNYEPLEVEASSLVGMVLTHAHLDHCGRLPMLLPKGFTGPIWMTPATRDLTELSLYDAAKIALKNQKPFLYDTKLVDQVLEQFQTVEYRMPFQLGDFIITMRDAGHILGSASLEVEDTKPNSEIRKIIFSGDLGNTPEPLLKPTEFITSGDAVVMESTYGDRLHPTQDPVEVIQAEINAVETAGGDSTLLIPAFSLERTQQLLHMIMHLKKEGRVSIETPIFLDSPMGQKATEIYKDFPQLFNEHIHQDLKQGSPFEFPALEVVPGHEESQAIYHLPGPKVIIAGSGMMTGGRIMGHAAHYLSDPSTRLLIVGYQGEGTIGRQILDGARKVTINNLVVEIKAVINDTQAMSAHADQQQLMNWLKRIEGVKKVFLTHGEDGPREVLAQKITTELGIGDVVRPVLNQEISF